jgi:hypothetical protein
MPSIESRIAAAEANLRKSAEQPALALDFTQLDDDELNRIHVLIQKAITIGGDHAPISVLSPDEQREYNHLAEKVKQL